MTNRPSAHLGIEPKCWLCEHSRNNPSCRGRTYLKKLNHDRHHYHLTMMPFFLSIRLFRATQWSVPINFSCVILLHIPIEFLVGFALRISPQCKGTSFVLYSSLRPQNIKFLLARPRLAEMMIRLWIKLRHTHAYTVAHRLSSRDFGVFRPPRTCNHRGRSFRVDSSAQMMSAITGSFVRLFVNIKDTSIPFVLENPDSTIRTTSTSTFDPASPSHTHKQFLSIIHHLKL